MGNSRNTGYLQNTVKVADNGDISLMHGSTMLMQISSSGAITTTGVISGSNALSASYAASASNALAAATASYILTAQTASYVLNGVSASYAASASNALSASNAVTAQTASFANTFTVASTLTAQTLVVQTITSSVDFVTGSTRFGSLSSNTHVFTGSMSVSGSFSLIGPSPSMILSSSGAGAIAQFSNISGSTFVGIDNLGSYIIPTQRGLAIYDVSATRYLYVTSSGVGVGTTSPITNFNVIGTSDSLGRVARFTNSLNSASIDIAHSSNGGVIGYANIGSGNLANVFYVSTGAGTVGSGIVMNNAGQVGFATSNVTESVQATGTISIIPNSSVSNGPLIQFAGNGRIRPASGGDRLSIDGNALYLNNFIGGDVATNIAGGNFGIGGISPSSRLYITGSNNGSTPLVDLRASGTGTFQRGVRLLNSGMNAGDHIMYAVGRSDNSRNMGQFYFYFAGDNSTDNSIRMGLHSVDDVFNITGNGFVGIGTTAPAKKFQVNAAVAGEVVQFNNTRNSAGDYVMVTTLGANANSTGAYHYIAATGGADKFYVYGNGTYTTVSDARLKKNITTVTDTYLDKVNNLRVVNYNWNDQQDGSPLELGMIAQEVEELIPSIVYEGREHEDRVKYKGIQVSSLPYILIKAIQELKAENDTLKEILQRNNIV